MRHCMNIGRGSTSFVPHVHITRSASSLIMMYRSMIDVASGGALMDKTPTAARHLISNMASNTRYYGKRGTIAPRMVNKIGESIDRANILVRQLAIGQHQSIAVVKPCGICTSMEHPTDMCPTLQETELDHPKSVGSIIREAATILAESKSRVVCSSRIQFKLKHASEPRQLSTAKSKISNLQFQQNMSAIVQDLKTQVGQLANSSTGSGNIPSQTIPNPRGNASIKPRSANTESKPDADSQAPQARPIPVPFPSWTLSARKLKFDEELLKMFRKVEINIPLLDAIKQIPKYAKFLKELCVHKRKKMKGGVELEGIVLALTRNDDLIAITRQALPKEC
ncbi:hypothetical protein CR513_27069, partial [Mucuna pruriens]